LYWRSWHDSPLDVHRGQPAEARVPQVLRTRGGHGLLSTGWPGPLSLIDRLTLWVQVQDYPAPGQTITRSGEPAAPYGVAVPF
jgi:hypothetical protein